MREVYVVRIAADALQQRGVLDAGHGLADGESGHGSFRGTGWTGNRMLAGVPYNSRR
jgi:hypothetical protein